MENPSNKRTDRENWRLHSDENTKPEDKPRFDVKKGLLELAHRERGLITTLAVLGHAKRQDLLLAWGQEPGILRAVWHEQVEENARRGSDGAANEEESSPGGQGQGLVPRDAVHEQATADLRHTVHGDPKPGGHVSWARQEDCCGTAYAVRSACSPLRYQMLVIVMKAGETAPSANPRRKRTAAKPA